MAVGSSRCDDHAGEPAGGPPDVQRATRGIEGHRDDPGVESRGQGRGRGQEGPIRQGPGPGQVRAEAVPVQEHRHRDGGAGGDRAQRPPRRPHTPCAGTPPPRDHWAVASDAAGNWPDSRPTDPWTAGGSLLVPTPGDPPCHLNPQSVQQRRPGGENVTTSYTVRGISKEFNLDLEELGTE